MVIQIQDKDKKEQICRSILEALPDWFGMPEGINEYTDSSRELPLWADMDGEVVRGFVVLKETSQYTAEVCVMGVRKEFHRLGIGKQLFRALYEFARENGYEFLQVKTVQDGFYESYNKTNAFYKSMGFKELECLETYWDKDNPCQIYVMSVK